MVACTKPQQRKKEENEGLTNQRIKKKAKCQEDREIRSSLLILDLKDGKL